MSKTEILNKTEEIESPTEKTIKLEKPKKPKTDAQVKAFEKARLKRAENIIKRQEERAKEKEDFDKLKEMKKQIKEIKIKKAQKNELKEIASDSESSESETEEVIVRKVKTTKSKPKPKKKVIYVDESDEEPDNKNVVIINKIQPPQPVHQHPGIKPKPKALFL